MTRDRDATAAVAAVRKADLERLARREGRKAGADDFAAAALAMRRLSPGGARGAGDEVEELVAKLDLSR